MTDPKHDHPSLSVRVRIREFNIPPVTDALVLGKKAPIGSEGMRRALSLLHVSPFEHIQVEDDEVIEDILVRTSVLNKVPRHKLEKLILQRVKPFMTAEEVINLDVRPELLLEEQL